MALIKCPECGKDVSDQAKVCPNCGVNLRKSGSLTIKCRECSKVYSSAGGVKSCPYCGASSKDAFLKRKPFFILVPILLILLIGTFTIVKLTSKPVFPWNTDKFIRDFNENGTSSNLYTDKYGDYEIITPEYIKSEGFDYEELIKQTGIEFNAKKDKVLLLLNDDDTCLVCIKLVLHKDNISEVQVIGGNDISGILSVPPLVIKTLNPKLDYEEIAEFMMGLDLGTEEKHASISNLDVSVKVDDSFIYTIKPHK